MDIVSVLLSGDRNKLFNWCILVFHKVHEGVFRTFRTSMMELFSESSSRLQTVNYFHLKSSIVDIRLGSKYA